MPIGGTYSTGTISVANGATLVTGAGVLWNDVIEGDLLWPVGYAPMFIAADVVTPFEQLTLLKAWPGTSLVAAPYVILKTSWRRYDVAELLSVFREVAAQLEATGNFVFVEGAVPDPELGDDGQFALKVNVAPWKLWYKVTGVWVLQGTPVGTVWRNAWSAATPYLVNDQVSRLGASYISILGSTNKPPESEPTYWDLVAAKGDTGNDGGVITIPFTFSTTTTVADPTPGKLRLNNATQNVATILVADLLDNRAIDFTLVFGAMFGTTSAVIGQIRLHKASDATKFLLFNVSAMTSPSGFRQFAVECIGSSGAAPFANDDAIVLNASRTGDKGTTGSIGATGAIGPIGHPGGAAALPYTVDGLSTMNSDPGVGKMRFGTVPQSGSVVLRFNTTTALGAPVGPLLAALASASTSAVKASGRLFVNGSGAMMEFSVTAVEALINYYNVTIQVLNSSAPDPFPDGSSVILDWSPKGDKGDAATFAIGTVTTGEPGTDAQAANVGTAQAAVVDFTFPRGDRGDAFSPTYVVALLAGRDAYDAGPVFNADGTRLSVLVESDSSNSNLPTLYFLQSIGPAVWSEGFTFEAAGAADAVSYDNTASGYAADNVQDAVDEAAEKIRRIPNPVAMAMIYGGF